MCRTGIPEWVADRGGPLGCFWLGRLSGNAAAVGTLHGCVVSVLFGRAQPCRRLGRGCVWDRQTDACPRSLPLSVPFCGRAYWSFTPSGHASCPHCWCDESVPVLPNGPDKARFGAQAEPGDFSRVRLKARSPAAAREPTRHGGSSVARRCSRSGFTDRGHATLAEQTS